MNRYADLFLRLPGVVLAFAIIASCAALFGATRLGFDDTPRGIFRSDDERFLELQQVQAQFGADDNDFVLVLEREDWFTPRGAELLRVAERDARAIPGVESVFSLASVIELSDGLIPRPLLPGSGAAQEVFDAARERAFAHPFVGGSLLSDDGVVALLLVRLSGDALSIEELDPAFAAVREVARGLQEAGCTVHVTGVPAFRVVIFNTIRRDQVVFTGLGALICFAVALLIFRSWRACFVVTVPTVFAAFWVTGGIGLVGGEIDLLGSVLPVLCILIAFTDSVHLAMDVQAERAAGRSLDESIRHALRKLGMPCMLTSITTAIGLGSLAVSGVPSIRTFGIQAFFSVLLVFIAVMTTLPLAARFLKPPPRALPTDDGRIASFFGWVLRRPGVVVALGVTATLGFLLASSTLVPENRLTESIPHDDEVFGGLQRYEQALGGMLPLYVLVRWEKGREANDPELLAGLRDVEALIESEPHLARPTSMLGLRALLPQGASLGVLPDELVARYLRAELRRTVVLTRIPDLGTDELRPLFERLERGLARIGDERPGLALSLTGTDIVARRTVNRMITDLAQGLLLAVVLIFGVIALEFRSLRMGLISLLPNVFPLAFIGAGLALFGQPLQIVTAVLFTVLLGLAVDDTIHYLARYRHERGKGSSPAVAARRAGAAVGAAIMTTTLALVAGYSAVFASAIPTNRLFAALLCVGLAAALIGDLILLPALLVLVDRRQRK